MTRPEDTERCDGSGKIPTGECKVAMSGPTCFDAKCPPCQHPETDPCPGCPDCQPQGKRGDADRDRPGDPATERRHVTEPASERSGAGSTQPECESDWRIRVCPEHGPSGQEERCFWCREPLKEIVVIPESEARAREEVARGEALETAWADECDARAQQAEARLQRERERLVSIGSAVLGKRAYERTMGDLPQVTPRWERADPMTRRAFIAQARDDLRYFVLPALSNESEDSA